MKLYNNERALIFGVRFPSTMFWIISAVGILSSVSNASLGIQHPLNAVGYLVSLIGIIVISLRKTKELLHIFLIITILIYCPSVFVVTEGFRGSNALFAVVGAFLFIALFLEPLKWGLVILEATIYIGLSVIQLYHPQLFAAYADETARMVAMAISIVLSFLGTAVSINFFINCFENQNQANVELLQKYTDLNEYLEELSIRDPLTGVFNRRYLEKTLESMITSKEDPGFSVLMLDLDYFKNINDTYGHAFGDWVLIEMCKSVKEQLRSTDILSRYGGEEFIVVLLEMKREQAAQIAERIRKGVSQIKSRESVAITISIGVAEYEKGQTESDLIGKADENLYKAKNAGRNRTVV